MTLDTPTAAAEPRRRDGHGPATLDASGAPGVLTRAEFRRRAAAQPAPDASTADTASLDSAAVPSLAEAVVADVAAAIMAETVGAQPDPSSRRRLRRAAQEVFAAVAGERVPQSFLAAPASSPAPAARAEDESCRLDEFEFAARLFSFHEETPAPGFAPRADGPSASPKWTTSPDVARRRPRRGAVVFQRVAAASFSIGVMAIVGMLTVGTTTPAAVVGSATASTSNITAVAKPKPASEIQAFVASGASGVATLDRPENYNVTSMAEIAADSGVTLFAGTWINDPDAAIQWPFPVGVPISAPFGSGAYLAQFSSPHRGVDLTPGLGADIHVIAAGTVRIATEAGGDYGVTVVVDHVVDGQLVSTRYGHMLNGSLQVAVGDTVKAGQVIGRVGQTGKATGPHLHFEVLVGGTTQIDPMPWMYEHTTGVHTVG